MRIVFLGDLSASGVFGQNIQIRKAVLSKEIKDFFREGGGVHVNLENPITDKPFRPDKKGAALRGPAELLHFIVSNGISICDLANNHIMDCGEEGLENTIKALEKIGISYYGIGKHPYLVVDHKDTRVALIASAHKEGPMGDMDELGPCYFSQKEIAKLVRYLRFEKRADFVVYNFHGGIEFNLVPEPRRRIFFHKLIQSGVDVVIGHHAHVPQGYERLENGVIFYGLGNFMFDLPYHRSKAFTNISFLLEMDFRRGEKIEFEQYYYWLDLDNGIIQPLDEKSEALRRYLERKMLVFESEAQYRKAWLDEALRVYMFNAPIQGEALNCLDHMRSEKPEFSDHLITWAKIMKRFPRHITMSHKRPFLIGSIQRMLRYGLL